MVIFLSTGATFSTSIFSCRSPLLGKSEKAGTGTRGGARGQGGWAEGESNPHGSLHRILSPARLPVPPPAPAAVSYHVRGDGRRPSVVDRQEWTRTTTTPRTPSASPPVRRGP